jgi:hypothetical protein
MKIRFLQDRTVQDAHVGAKGETKFKADQIVDLPDASANHWITRGVAEPYDEPAEKADKKGKAEK